MLFCNLWHEIDQAERVMEQVVDGRALVFAHLDRERLAVLEREAVAVTEHRSACDQMEVERMDDVDRVFNLERFRYGDVGMAERFHAPRHVRRLFFRDGGEERVVEGEVLFFRRLPFVFRISDACRLDHDTESAGVQEGVRPAAGRGDVCHIIDVADQIDDMRVARETFGDFRCETARAGVNHRLSERRVAFDDFDGERFSGLVF